MIRVLVVLPFYGGSLPVGLYAAQGLREAGCLVETFQAPAFYPAFTALKELKVGADKQDFLENSFLQVVGQAILAKVESFAPDLVLAMAQAPLPRQILKRLQKDQVATAMWFVEDFRLFTYWRAFAPAYDIFAVIQKEPFLEELHKLGVADALYLPLAALPSFHKPLTLGPAEQRRFGSRLSFMGAGYPNRRAIFRRLTKYDFKIWGTEWEGEKDLDSLVQEKGARISPEDTVRIYNAAEINLNLHSGLGSGVEITPGDFVNPRTFEVAACGAFQLVDQRALLPELFAPDELATFNTVAELQGAIDHYLARPEERQAMAQKAQARVLTEHTYKNRMETLLAFAGKRLLHYPAKRSASDWPEGMPAELSGELNNLLEKLALPPHAEFDTVITALRLQSGRLAPLESALLFMDEWRKQYLRR